MPTPDKQKLLDLIKAQLIDQAGETDQQKAVGKAIYDQLQAKLTDSSKLEDVFATMQEVADHYKTEMQTLVTKNIAESKDAQDIKKYKGQTKVVMTSATELNGLADAVNKTFSQDNIQAIVDNAANVAGYTATPDKTYAVDATFHAANIITEVDRSEYAISAGLPWQHTAPVAGQGKANPKRAMHWDNVGTVTNGVFTPLPKDQHEQFIIRGDMFPNDGIQQWESLDLVADAIVKKWGKKDIPLLAVAKDIDGKPHDASVATGTRAQKREAVIQWLTHAVPLKHDKGGVECDGKFPFDPSPVIFTGQALPLPPGTGEIAPAQAWVRCKTCEVNSQFKDVDTKGAAAAPIEPVTTTYIPTPDDYKPRASVRQNTPSTNGSEYVIGTMDYTGMLGARSGVFSKKDEKGRYTGFTENYNTIDHNAARERAILASQTGLNSDSKTMEGDHFIGDNGHKTGSPDKNVKKDNYGTGDHGVVGFIGGATERIYTPNELSGATDYGYDRADHLVVRTARGGKNIALFRAFGVTVPLGPMSAFGLFDIPYGAAVTNPSHQTPIYGAPDEHGIILGHAIGDKAGFDGYNNLWKAQQSQGGNFMLSVDRFGDPIKLESAGRWSEFALKKLDEAQTPEQKTEAATIYLTALRDIKQNTIIKDNGALNASGIPQMEDAAVTLLKRKGFDDATITQLKTDIGVDADKPDFVKYPELKITLVPAEEFKQQQAHGNHSRYNTEWQHVGTDVNSPTGSPGDPTSDKFNAWSRKDTNYFEVKLASAEYSDPKQKEAIADQRAGIESIIFQKDQEGNVVKDDKGQPLKNVASTKAALEFTIKHHPVDAHIPTSQATWMDATLHDMIVHPENYGFKDRHEAVEWEAGFLGADHKQAVRDTKKKGSSSAIPFLRDWELPVGHPVAVIDAIAEQYKKDPEGTADKFNNLLDRVSNTQLGLDDKNRTDGRRFGVGFVRSFATEHVEVGDYNKKPEGYTNVEGTLNGNQKAIDALDKAVTTATLFGEEVGRVSVQGKNSLDNTYARLMNRHAGQQEMFDVLFVNGDPKAKHQTTPGLTDDEATAQNAAIEKGLVGLRSQAAVSGLYSHPALAEQTLLAAVLKHPDLLNSLPDKLKATHNEDLLAYLGKLNGTIQDVIKLNSEGKQDEAVKEWGAFFTQMEANGDIRKGGIRERSVRGLVLALGSDPVTAGQVMDTIKDYPVLLNATLKAIPDIIPAIDDANFNPALKHGRHEPTIIGVRDDKIFNDKDGAKMPFYDLPVDDHGDVHYRKQNVLKYIGLSGTNKVIISDDQHALLSHGLGRDPAIGRDHDKSNGDAINHSDVVTGQHGKQTAVVGRDGSPIVSGDGTPVVTGSQANQGGTNNPNGNAGAGGTNTTSDGDANANLSPADKAKLQAVQDRAQVFTNGLHPPIANADGTFDSPPQTPAQINLTPAEVNAINAAKTPGAKLDIEAHILIEHMAAKGILSLPASEADVDAAKVVLQSPNIVSLTNGHDAIPHVQANEGLQGTEEEVGHMGAARSIPLIWWKKKSNSPIPHIPPPNIPCYGKDGNILDGGCPVPPIEPLGFNGVPDHGLGGLNLALNQVKLHNGPTV